MREREEVGEAFRNRDKRRRRSRPLDAVTDDGGRPRRRVGMLVVRPRQTALSARRYLSVFFEEERYIGGAVREQSRG